MSFVRRCSYSAVTATPADTCDLVLGGSGKLAWANVSSKMQSLSPSFHSELCRKIAHYCHSGLRRSHSRSTVPLPCEICPCNLSDLKLPCLSDLGHQSLFAIPRSSTFAPVCQVWLSLDFAAFITDKVVATTSGTHLLAAHIIYQAYRARSQVEGCFSLSSPWLRSTSTWLRFLVSIESAATGCPVCSSPQSRSIPGHQNHSILKCFLRLGQLAKSWSRPRCRRQK